MDTKFTEKICKEKEVVDEEKGHLSDWGGVGFEKLELYELSVA